MRHGVDEGLSMAAITKKPPSSVNVTFLGTASAVPSVTRNHSSLALRLGGDVWLFDCGEATQHQIQKSSVKMGKIQKIFITHTHGKGQDVQLHSGTHRFLGDHIFGLVPLLASRLNGAGGLVLGQYDPRTNIDLSQPVWILLHISGLYDHKIISL